MAAAEHRNDRLYDTALRVLDKETSALEITNGSSSALNDATVDTVGHVVTMRHGAAGTVEQSQGVESACSSVGQCSCKGASALVDENGSMADSYAASENGANTKLARYNSLSLAVPISQETVQTDFVSSKTGTYTDVSKSCSNQYLKMETQTFTTVKITCIRPLTVVVVALDKVEETNKSNAPFAFDGDIGINTLSMSVLAIKESLVSFVDVDTEVTVGVTIYGLSTGVCGNLGATILQTSCGAVEGSALVDEFTMLVNTVHVPCCVAKAVPQVACKFTEGMTSMASCDALIKVDEREKKKPLVEDVSDVTAAEVHQLAVCMFDSSFASKENGAADLGVPGPVTPSENPAVVVSGCSIAAEDPLVMPDLVGLVCDVVSNCAETEVNDDREGLEPCHRNEPSPKVDVFPDEDERSKPSGLTGDRESSAGVHFDHKTYAYLNIFNSASEYTSQSGQTHEAPTYNTETEVYDCIVKTYEDQEKVVEFVKVSGPAVAVVGLGEVDTSKLSGADATALGGQITNFLIVDSSGVADQANVILTTTSFNNGNTCTVVEVVVLVRIDKKAVAAFIKIALQVPLVSPVASFDLESEDVAVVTADVTSEACDGEAICVACDLSVLDGLLTYLGDATGTTVGLTDAAGLDAKQAMSDRTNCTQEEEEGDVSMTSVGEESLDEVPQETADVTEEVQFDSETDVYCGEQLSHFATPLTEQVLVHA